MLRTICHYIMKKRGWTLVNDLPPHVKKAVAIGYPHTSNWDFFVAMWFIKESKINTKFAIKKEWLFFPVGYFLKKLGAVGIDRSSRFKKSTQLMADLFSQFEELFLIIAPEGTRSRKEKWKSGYYYTAVAAEVPIVTIKGNFDTRTIYLGQLVIEPSDMKADMAKIMNYYRDAVGCRPENHSIDLRFN